MAGVFLGNLADPDDEDWVRVELQADTTYVIRLQGRGEDPVNDPLPELYRGKLEIRYRRRVPGHGS